MKLASLKIENFKQFDSFQVRFRDVNILVGPNNAGKSTTLDAIRILSDVLDYAKRRRPTMQSHGEHGVCETYTLDNSLININILNCVRNYGDDDARLVFTHQNGAEFVISVHPDRPLKAYLRHDGAAIRNSAHIKSIFPLDIIVVPTLGPFEVNEPYVMDQTVNRNENTRLAHRSFRNILLRKTPEEFEEFSSLVNKAWPHITLSPPEIERYSKPIVSMFFAEHRLDREISTSGFGFQIWMQVMTQVMRGNKDSVLVLDEPDIYLHPDLQRKLVKLVRSRFGQIFIATHSAEIINEVNPGDVVSINSQYKRAKRITSADGYRDIFNYIGSSENTEFASIARAQRIVFFEGKDRKLLKKFAEKSNNLRLLDDDATVFLQAGGFGQWKRVKEVGWTLSSLFGMNIKIAAVFDRDYRCDAEILDFINNMNASDIKCRVLGRKEIENYALDRRCLSRALIKRGDAVGHPLSQNQVDDLIDKVVDEMRDNVRSHRVANKFAYLKKTSPSVADPTLMGAAMVEFDDAWKNVDNRLALIPGKEFISVLSAKLHDACGASVTINQIISEIKSEEVACELSEILLDIESFFAV